MANQCSAFGFPVKDDLKELHPVIGDYLSITLPEVKGKYGGNKKTVIAKITEINFIRSNNAIDGRYDVLKVNVQIPNLYWHSDIHWIVYADYFRASMWYRRKPLDKFDTGINGLAYVNTTTEINTGF